MRWVPVFISLIFMGCGKDAPHPTVAVSEVPWSVVKVTSHWKRGEFTVGYRIVTKNYVFISDGGGLYGQTGSLAGPGLVDHRVIADFGPIAEMAEQAKDKDMPMMFYGDQVPSEFEGRTLVLLNSMRYEDNEYVVNRE